MQKRSKKALSICTAASLLVAGSAVSNVKAASTGSSRLYGADRYETAAKVSQNGWTSSDYAVIASGEAYPDALCAAPLAKANNAPILLTSKGSLNQSTLDELKRLNVKHVYIVGGEGAVSAAVENQIKAVASDVQRLAGQTRYETSIKVAQKLGTTTKVVLASGETYADALSIAPVAAMEGMPIILTESSSLSQAASDYIKSNSGITKTYVIGGSGAVSDSAVSGVPGAQRFGGSDRYETNKLVVEGFSSDFSFGNAYVAIGNGPLGNEFADALSVSALAAKNKNPLIITGQTLSDYTKALMKEKLTTSSTLTVLGGTGVISDGLVADMNSAVTGTTASSGGSSSGGGVTSNTLYYSAAGPYTVNAPGDVYITGSGVSITGTVAGTVYVNPGKEGEATLQNLTAKNIVVQSGAANTITFDSVKADSLKVDLSASGDDNVHVKTIGNTKIINTELDSNVKLDSQSGSFGNITIPQTTSTSAIEFVGIFDRPITVQGNANIKTDDGVIIPALVIPEGVNALGIILAGNGTINNIQVRSKDAKITIPASIVVTGSIVAVDKSTVTTTKTVDEKPADQMDNITTYKDRTSDIASKLGSKISTYLANHPDVKDYFSVSTAGNAINVQLNKGSLNSLSSAFDRTQAQDLTTIEDKLTKAQQQLDLHSSYIKIDGGSVRDLFMKLNAPKYINNDGGLNVQEIATEIKAGTLTYDQFTAYLQGKIEAVYSNSKPKLTMSYDGFTQDITSIVKDGKTVYSTSLSTDDNIKYLLDLGNSTPGTYTINCGQDYFTITVQAK